MDRRARRRFWSAVAGGVEAVVERQVERLVWGGEQESLRATRRSWMSWAGRRAHDRSCRRRRTARATIGARPTYSRRAGMGGSRSRSWSRATVRSREASARPSRSPAIGSRSGRTTVSASGCRRTSSSRAGSWLDRGAEAGRGDGAAARQLRMVGRRSADDRAVVGAYGVTPVAARPTSSSGTEASWTEEQKLVATGGTARTIFG